MLVALEWQNHLLNRQLRVADRTILKCYKTFPSAGGNLFEKVDFSSWNHATDGGLLSNLTFNDQTNMFYSNYGTFEKGVLTSVGVSFPALSNDGRSALVEGGKSKWYERASGRMENTYPEFDLFFASTKTGWNIVKGVFSSMVRPFSTTNTFDAVKSGFARGDGSNRNREKTGVSKGNMSANRGVQKEQIEALCTKHGLNKDERQVLHRLVGGEGYGYHEVEQVIKDYFNK